MVVSSLFFGGFDTGWTGYPPLSVRAPLGVQMFLMGVYIIGLSSIFGSINVIVTTFKMRAPGMSLFKMPIFVWAALATALIQLTATQLIGLSFQMVMLQRLFGMSFFDATNGGNPILFQHLFWFYSHPAVYVFILPGLGIISELLPVFVRKPLFGYKWIALSSMAIALVGFFVWAHHMFTSGMTSYLRVPFMYSTMLVAVPTGVKFFSWVGTLWKGKITFPTPMLFVLGSIVIFLMGGVSGPPNGTVATDLHLHDTYWVVGHFHNTMFGGYIFPFFAAIYYWFPKITGKKYKEIWGKVHFWAMFIGFEVMSITQMRVGLLGMRRRIADYDPALGIENSQYLITVAGFLVFFSVVIGLINLIASARKGEVAEGNVWNSRSPEWQIPSPAPLHNYDHPFAVVGEPYDYGRPEPYVDMNPAPAPSMGD
jgi:cytochrome c oxidase subunit 1